tara:strand:+ start:49 stop:798 length:750 start_codon:yes stop_codon:yes gene_type:complete
MNKAIAQSELAWQTSGLRSGYGRGDDIVRGVDLAQKPDTILGVFGPNGSGKSTFIKTIAGLVTTRAGTIAIMGRQVEKLSPARRTEAGLAYVPQDKNIFASMSVHENLLLATEFMRGRAGVGKEREAFVLSLFPDIAQRRRLLAGYLSGGQRQMLAMACALLSNPRVLLLDEPSAGLSPKFVDQIMEAVLQVRATGVTVVLVEQNVAAGLAVADDALILVQGQVAHQCRAKDLSLPAIESLFMNAGQAA